MSTTNKPSRNDPAARPNQNMLEAGDSSGPSGEGQTGPAPAKKTGRLFWLWAIIPLLLIIAGLVLERLRGD
jgi:hypothetical protein